MEIRLSTIEDIKDIRQIYEHARNYMAENGNPGQWDNGYPTMEMIQQDILDGISYVIISDNEIVGVFVFIMGIEPTYNIIEKGAWSLDKPYGCIHRIASSGKRKGLTAFCFDYCLSQIDYLRIDTHKNNKSMQAALKKYGFTECGIIHVHNGERIAFDFLK